MSKYLMMADVFKGEVKAKHIDEECIAEIVHGDDSGGSWTIEDSRYWMAMQHEHASYAAHAINSHDELVEINKELLDALEMVISDKAPGYHDCIDDGEQECAWCVARSAIAKAKGGAA